VLRVWLVPRVVGAEHHEGDVRRVPLQPARRYGTAVLEAVDGVKDSTGSVASVLSKIQMSTRGRGGTKQACHAFGAWTTRA
jgi:hypothetical protein